MSKPKRKQPLGQTIGGVLFGFEQQVLRNQPPPEELVRHARPDSPIPAGDGTLITIGMPDDAGPEPPADDGGDDIPRQGGAGRGPTPRP